MSIVNASSLLHNIYMPINNVHVCASVGNLLLFTTTLQVTRHIAYCLIWKNFVLSDSHRPSHNSYFLIWSVLHSPSFHSIYIFKPNWLNGFIGVFKLKTCLCKVNQSKSKNLFWSVWKLGRETETKRRKRSDIATCPFLIIFIPVFIIIIINTHIFLLTCASTLYIAYVCIPSPIFCFMHPILVPFKVVF